MTNKKKPWVRRSTVWQSVGGGLSYPGEQKICKVGKHKVLLVRSEKLNRYGNPVHTATLSDRHGRLGRSHRGTGSATMIAEEALRRNGIDVKHPKPKRVAKRK